MVFELYKPGAEVTESLSADELLEDSWRFPSRCWTHALPACLRPLLLKRGMPVMVLELVATSNEGASRTGSVLVLLHRQDTAVLHDCCVWF